MEQLFNILYFATWYSKDSGYSIEDIETCTKVFNEKILSLLSNPKNKVIFRDTGEKTTIGELMECANEFSCNWWYKKFKGQPENTILGLRFYEFFLKDISLPEKFEVSEKLIDNLIK